MDAQSLEGLTSAVAPIVMVSAAGLLFNGVQAKNLHLSDRIRSLAAEYRHQETTPDRRAQVTAQVGLFDKRIRLSQGALELLYIAILSFVANSLLLASSLWIGPRVLPAVTTGIFVLGVLLLFVALVLEFVEMWVGLKTIEIEVESALGQR